MSLNRQFVTWEACFRRKFRGNCMFRHTVMGRRIIRPGCNWKSALVDCLYVIIYIENAKV